MLTPRLALTWNSAPSTSTASASAAATRFALATTCVDPVGRKVGQEHEELVAAGTGQQVPVALELLEPAGDGHEQLVADGMSEAVVHQLEVVEVQAEEPHRAAGQARALDRRVHALRELRAVGKPGQRVVVGEEGHSLLGQAAVGDVLA